MATFVQLGESDPAFDLLKLINHVTEAKMTEAQFKADPVSKLLAAEKPDYAEFLTTKFFPSLPKLLSSSADEIDFAFSLAFSLFPTITKELPSLISKFTEALTSDPSSNSLLKLRLLTILFNILDSTSPLRHSVFSQTLSFAIAAKSAQTVHSHVDSIDDFIDQWKLTGAAVSDLYLLASKVCEASKDSDAQLKFQKRYLRTLNGIKDAKRVEAAIPYAASAVLSALKSGSLADCSLLASLDAVQALKSSNAQLFALLDIFVNGSVEGYSKFTENKTNVEFLANNGLDQEDCLEKMRTLTICSMGATQETLTYKDIQARLQLANGDEVEAAVINAVVSKKMDARMDQENEIVHIQRTQTRRFNGKKDWSSLSTKLEQCRLNINNVLVNMPVAQPNMDM